MAAAVAGVTVIYASSHWLSGHARFEIVERYEFTAEQDCKIGLAVITPRTGPYQKVNRTSISWEGRTERNAYGNVDVHYAEGEIVEGRRKEAVITIDVTLRSGPLRWYSALTQADRNPEPEIQSDHPEIKAAAARLDGAAGVCDFVSRHLKSPRMPGPPVRVSALEALRNGKGAAAEHASLMTALCRADGIAARSISGLSLRELGHLPFWRTPERRAGHPAQPHAWVEIYDGRFWQMADPALHSPLWPSFGTNNGTHLSYGESAETGRVQRDIEAWAASFGYPVGAMDSPLRFAAGATDSGVALTPYATVTKKTDTAWYAAAAGLALLAIAVFFVAGLLPAAEPEAIARQEKLAKAGGVEKTGVLKPV